MNDVSVDQTQKQVNRTTNEDAKIEKPSQPGADQSLPESSIEVKEIVEVVYEPAEVPQEYVDQFGIRKERKAGHVKVD